MVRVNHDKPVGLLRWKCHCKLGLVLCGWMAVVPINGCYSPTHKLGPKKEIILHLIFVGLHGFENTMASSTTTKINMAFRLGVFSCETKLLEISKCHQPGGMPWWKMPWDGKFHLWFQLLFPMLIMFSPCSHPMFIHSWWISAFLRKSPSSSQPKRICLKIDLPEHFRRCFNRVDSPPSQTRT